MNKCRWNLATFKELFLAPLGPARATHAQPDAPLQGDLPRRALAVRGIQVERAVCACYVQLMDSTRLFLYSAAERVITKEWLEHVTPVGSKVREIPLPGFMINDVNERSAVSVRVRDEETRRHMIERLRTMRGMRPPEELLAQLDARRLLVEVDVLRGRFGKHHPIARAIAKALGAIVDCYDKFFDEDLCDLSAAFPSALPSSGAPPYDPDSAIDFRAFRFDGYVWQGRIDVPWLGGVTAITVNAASTPIPMGARRVIERIGMLPSDVRSLLEAFLFREIRKNELPFGDPPMLERQSDIWRHVSQAAIAVPEKPTHDESFIVTFECTWDVENGIYVMFDHEARPTRLGAQCEADIFESELGQWAR